MKTLQEKFEKVVKKYIKIFEREIGIDFDFWIGDIAGEIAAFGDYFFNFSDIKYFVDNVVNEKYIFDWYHFTVEYPNCYYKIDAYVKLRQDFEYQNGFGFDLHEFEKYLLYLRIKSDEK